MVEAGRKGSGKCKMGATGRISRMGMLRGQQAAEKAIKALYERLGGEAWGHSLFNLLKGLKEKMDIPEEIMKAGKFLDRFYVPARYPNGWQAGIPADYYSEEDSKSAINSAEKILWFCKNILAG